MKCPDARCAEEGSCRITLLALGWTEGSFEELFDRASTGIIQQSGSRPREPCPANPGSVNLLPGSIVPLEPASLGLVENIECLIEMPSQLGPPAGAPLDGLVVEDLTDNEDFSRGCNLVPDALEDSLEFLGFGKRSV